MSNFFIPSQLHIGEVEIECSPAFRLRIRHIGVLFELIEFKLISSELIKMSPSQWQIKVEFTRWKKKRNKMISFKRQRDNVSLFGLPNPAQIGFKV